MNYLEFLVWVVGIIVIGIPALACATIIAVAWIDTKAHRASVAQRGREWEGGEA